MGDMLAYMCMLVGSVLISAAWYTVGVVGGLNTIAVRLDCRLWNQ